MNETNTYIKETIKLANSIIFKFDHINIYINNNILRQEGIIPTDERNSKYYLNLNGLPFETDRELITYIPDISDYGVLTKDSLAMYPLLRTELQSKGTLYEKLISNYGKEGSLIKGIIRPIDIDTAIEADDGAILYYDKTLVQDNEYSLIIELELYIKTMIESYYNKKYNIDEYYLPGFLSTIFNNLPLQIIKIRLSKMHTAEVCDYHLYTYLNSYKYMVKDDLSFMNRKSLIWLYGNLRHLIKNMGSNSTLFSIIDNIYEVNTIGVAKLNIYNPIPVINETTDIHTVNYNKDRMLVSEKLNSSYNNNNEEFSLDNIISLEYDLNHIHNNDYDITYNNDKAILDRMYKDSNTKVFMYDKVDIKIMYNTTILNIIFNNLLYYSKQAAFKLDAIFFNPSDNTYVEVNKDNAFYVLLYAMVSISGQDADTIHISDYTIDGIVNSNLSIDDLVKNTVLKEKLIPIVKDIMDIGDDLPSVIDAYTFVDRVAGIKTMYSKIWSYITNSNDIIISADLKTVFNNYLTTYTFQEDENKTLREILDEKVGEGFLITEELAMQTITSFSKELFGLDVDEYVNIEDTFNKYIKFINNFKSYTIQFLFETNYLKTIFTYSNNITIGQQHKTVGSVYNSYFRRNNNLNTLLNSISFGYTDKNIMVYNIMSPYEIIDESDTPLVAEYISDINLNDIYISNEISGVDMTPIDNGLLSTDN